MPILHLSQLIGVAAGLRGVGAEVQAARRLGRAGPREAAGLKRARRASRAAALGWAWFEAGWVRLETPTSRCRACRPSSTACGSRTSPTSTSACPARGAHAVERAVEWVEERQPDLAVTRRPAHARVGRGDAPRGSLPRLPRCLRDPRQPRPRDQPRPVRRANVPARARAGDAALRRGRDDRAARPARLHRRRRPALALGAQSRPQPRDLAVPRDEADLRILLAHYPGARRPAAAGRVRPRPRRPHARRPDLPAVSGRQAAARAPAARVTRAGSTAGPAASMHVSAGLGTTFVPFRFAARPEATELVLQGEGDEHAGRRPDGRDARDDAERLPRVRLVAVARSGARRTSGAGSSGSRTTRAPGAPSTTTTTGGCSARCSSGRRSFFPRAQELPAGPPSDDAFLSRARTSSSRRRRG